jgi:hypothetical protein
MHRFFAYPAIALALALTISGFNSPAAHADSRDFTLYNDTGQVISYVYVSASNETDWGDDVLGRDVLDDGDNVFIYFKKFNPVSCLYDIKVVTSTGAEGSLTQVNLCDVDTVTFH